MDGIGVIGDAFELIVIFDNTFDAKIGVPSNVEFKVPFNVPAIEEVGVVDRCSAMTCDGIGKGGRDIGANGIG